MLVPVAAPPPPKVQLLDLLCSSLSGSVRSVYLAVNLPSWLTIPMNILSSGTVIGGCISINYCSRLVGVGSNFILVYHVSQELQAGFSEFAFVWLECCPCCLNSVKDCGYSGVVLSLTFSKDKHIICLAVATFYVFQYVAHPLLKVFRST